MESESAQALPVDATLLVRVSKRFRSEMESHLKGGEINHCQFWILHKVDLNGGMTQGALSSLTGIDRAALVSLIDDLEEKNCVTRNEIPDDRRANRIELTTRGREVLRESRKTFRALQQRFFSRLDEKEKLQLNRLLEKLV